MVGGILRYDSVINSFSGKIYSGGDIFAIMACFMTGIGGLSQLGPVGKIITEGRIAGKLAFDVIDAVPEVDGNAKESKMITDAS